ncbi:uncharacterized protein LOC115321354 [Ixodes scapularis]|uniref:uncharacterized protein LOC115321354 n=1 Tax=Ixodes scapularis TaxID=6945 RepID=UPI001A9D9550|nr:uncharacterized protein LOC115321354 [Ixodes scapularis]
MNAYHEKKSVKKKKNKKTKEYCSDNDEKKNHKDKENTDSEEEGIYLEREVREEIPETGEDDFPDERKTSRNAANKNKTKDTKKDRPQTQELSQASLEELLKTIAELTRTTIKVMDENAKIKAELSRINEQTELIIQENLHLRELDLLQNNARLNESEKARTKTYSQALGTQSDDNNETPKQDDNEQEKKYTLLVTTKGSQEKDDHIKVGNLLKKSIDPADVGLTDVRLKPIRGGLAITTNSKEAIDKLERKINETKDTREKLEYKKPKERNPQISITQVERELTEEEITKAIIHQNKIEAGEDEIKIIQTFRTNNGTNTQIIELSANAFRQLINRKRLLIGWTSCPVRENIYVPRCLNCSSYGHTQRQCQNRATCPECAGQHRHQEYEVITVKCKACSNSNEKFESQFDTNHKFTDPLCPTYKAQVERIRQRTSY